MSVRVFYDILNQKGTPAFYSDTFANRPTYGFAGRVFISTDSGQIFEDTGSAWTLIADAGVGGGTLASVTANGNTTATGIVITAGGLSSNSITNTGNTAGSVLFAGTSGLESQSNATFFWDNTNKRLGIGNASPGAPLDIHGTGTQIQANGTGANNSYIQFQNAGVSKWRIGNTYSAGANTFDLYNNSLTSTALSFNVTTNAATFNNSITATSVAISGGTSAQILAADGSVITAGTNITISGGTISSSGGGGGITGTGTTNTLPKFTGSTAIGNSNITDSGTLISLGSDTTISSGALGIGTSTLTGYSLNVAKNITGATTAYGIISQGTVQSDVTVLAANYGSLLNTATTSFTLTDYVHYRAMQGTIGASSVVTNQYGLYVDSSMTGATNNYGFYGGIASGTNRWNLYMNGTAANYLAGVLNIGSTTLSVYKLDVNGTTRLQGSLAIDHTSGASINIKNGGTDDWAVGEFAGAADRNYRIYNFNTASINLTVDRTTGQVSIPNLSATLKTTILDNTNGGQLNIYYNGTADWNVGENTGAATRDYNIYNYNTSSVNLSLRRSSGNLLLNTLTDAGYKFDCNGTTRLNGQTTLTGSVTAASALAQGIIATPTLVAAANSDVLVGLDVSPTFTNGAFTPVQNYGIRTSGNIKGSNFNTVLASNPTQSYITIIGNGVAPSITGQYNIGIGGLHDGVARSTAQAITSGISNVIIGQGSGVYISTGSQNIGLGDRALNGNSGTQANNVAVGSESLNVNTGSANTALGRLSGSNVTSGSNNVFLGTQAARYQADGSTALALTGNNNIYIGQSSRGFNNSDTNAIVIGNTAIGLGSNTTVIGNSSTTNASIFGRVNVNGATDNSLFSLNTNGTLYTIGFSPNATANSTNTLTLTTAQTTWIYNGTGVATWTLFNPSGTNQMIWIKNAGTGIITLNAYSGTNIINNSGTSVTSITIAVGATALIQQDGGTKSYQLQ